MEIIDAQIHEPRPPKALPESYGEDVRLLVNVELAREAMDSVGVDIALVFGRQEFCDAVVARYPDRFVGAATLDARAQDIEEVVAGYRGRPGMLAVRSLIANWQDATLKDEFRDGLYEPLYAAAEKHNLPVFFSTHGHAAALEPVARAHQGLTMIVDHLGVSQSPVSPARAEPWDRLDGLLGLAQFPNVAVKFSGAPTLSSQPLPHKDVWPYLHQVVNAFGPARLMWGSDFTRLRQVPVTGGQAPRTDWHFYSDSVAYLRDTQELSQADKELLFAGSIRRILRWSKTS